MITLDEIYEVLPGAQWMAKGYLLGNCPFHDDKKRSLLVYTDGWICKGECNTSSRNLGILYDALLGQPTRPVEKTGKPPKLEATLPFMKSTQVLDEKYYAWEQRGIEKWVVTDCRLGYLAPGWLTIPVFDSEGFLETMLARSTPAQEAATGLRFTQVTGAKPTLYVPCQTALDRMRPIFVTFGVIDAISVYQCGFNVCTPSSGMNSLDVEWMDWPSYVIFVPDKGEEAVARKYAAQLGWKGSILKLDYQGHEKDPNDMLRNRREDLICQLRKVTAT